MKRDRNLVLLLLTTVGAMLLDLGVVEHSATELFFNWGYHLVLMVCAAHIFLRYLATKGKVRKRVWIVDLVMLGIIAVVWGHFLLGGLSEGAVPMVYAVMVVIFLRELSQIAIVFRRSYLTPPQLFVLSFLFLILMGTGLLLLPNATANGISVVDALFTSTSAVCVTGLVVVDTGTYFTQFGQVIILLLFQLGGIGIMTLTSYFSYFFQGGSSYENHLALKDMVNSDRLGEVFSVLKNILVLTFSIEAIGAIFVYMTLEEDLYASAGDKLYFAIFHAVSSFCNAGFSTLSNSLYDIDYRFNYSLQLAISFLFVLGGIGFPILFNTLKYLRYQLVNKLIPLGLNQQVVYRPWVINLNTRIVLITTAALLMFGTVLFLLFEYNNTLAEHSAWGKVVVAFFSGTAPRTAGFNAIDTSIMLPHTIMIVLFLMWVGGSPASTGGGIKTTTFAIGTLHILSMARGKDRIEVFKRQISDQSVNKAFAIISLSLIMLGLTTFFLVLFEPDQSLIVLAFESFSAFCTVGLSLGITGSLSDPSKVTLVFAMFLGRVTMLTFLLAIFRRVRHLKYRYPSEDIIVN